MYRGLQQSPQELDPLHPLGGGGEMAWLRLEKNATEGGKELAISVY